MPRLPRLHVPGGCYHVVMRGNHREDLFSTPHDRHVLNDIVAEALAEMGARLHAFCWMTNHLHALILATPAKSTRDQTVRVEATSIYGWRIAGSNDANAVAD